MFGEAIPGDEDPSRLGGPALELVVKTEQKYSLRILALEW